MKKTSTFYLLLSILCFLLSNLYLCFAQSKIEITPTIIDREAEARDVIEFSVKIENQGDSKVDLYPLVNDVLIREGQQEILDPYKADKAISLARWIRIPRARIELWPGEEKDIPFSVEVHLSAKPGRYHATITFSPGSSGPEAEANALKFNQPQVMLNIEVTEHIVEKAQIKKFLAEKNFFLDFPIKFLLEIENIGNREIQPEGFIYIYNRKGEEVGLIPINQASVSISPIQSNLFESIWQIEKGLGQYKAKLVVEYGNKEKRDIQDTVYFWILPWKFLTFLGGGLFIIILAGIFLAKTKKTPPSSPSSEKRLNKIIDLKSLSK